MTDIEQKRIEAICEIANIKDIGDLSDGFHTFNDLYHQRAVLFATIVNQNKKKSWKSWKHSDENYCFDSNGEWFIVGIDTPAGSYTYHYSKEYWDMFECQELECGKEWDGHTDKDVERLLSLTPTSTYIKVARCKFCNSRKRQTRTDYEKRCVIIRCMNCKYEVEGKNVKQAKINWNKIMEN